MQRSPNQSFEALEARTLLSGGNFSAHVNFAPKSAAHVSGYVVDAGGAYGSRNGLRYGWTHSHYTDTRNRDASNSPGQRYDTLMQMPPGEKWEIAVPNGTYRVHVVAGDPRYWNSVYRINAEGKTIINAKPSSRTRWSGNTITVKVSDGHLTLTSGSGARNNKLDYVDITRVPSSGSTGSSASKIAPAKPSNLHATGVSSSAVKLTWTDNSSRESGFRIERSADGGKSYGFVTNVAKNVKSYTDTGRGAGKTYRYRVRAYNSYGHSLFSVADNGTTHKSAPSPKPTPKPTPNPKPTKKSSDFYWMNVGMGSDPSRAIPVLRDLKIKGVRIYNPLSAWSNRWPSNPVFAAARRYHDAGIKVTLCVTCVKVPTYDQAKAYFQYVLNLSGMKSAVDRWEIQNEPDLSKYFAGSLKQYVSNELRAAWDVLHPRGEKVVGAGVLTTGAARTMVAAGYNKYVDIANIHPYADSVDNQKFILRTVKSIYGSKPLTATEWNFHTGASPTEWADMLKQVQPFIASNLESVYYYRLGIANTAAGAAGVVYGNYSRHEPFYDAVKSWTD